MMVKFLAPDDVLAAYEEAIVCNYKILLQYHNNNDNIDNDENNTDANYKNQY